MTGRVGGGAGTREGEGGHTARLVENALSPLSPQPPFHFLSQLPSAAPPRTRSKSTMTTTTTGERYTRCGAFYEAFLGAAVCV